MRINGRPAQWEKGLTLAAAASRHKPGADIGVVDGCPVPSGEWNGFILPEGAEAVLARRGEMPPPDEYQALLQARNQPGTTERLAAATVGVAGCGGLGSHAALSLARMGVGHLVLADFDVVEPTNLNRQAYFADDIGKPKVAALAALIARVNPVAKVSTHAVKLAPGDIGNIFSGSAILLECLDGADQKSMLVETALAKLPETVVVAASGLAGLASGNLITVRRVMARLWLVGDGDSGLAPGVGLAAPRVEIAAAHQALCAARIILGLEHP